MKTLCGMNTPTEAFAMMVRDGSFVVLALIASLSKGKEAHTFITTGRQCMKSMFYFMKKPFLTLEYGMNSMKLVIWAQILSLGVNAVSYISIYLRSLYYLTIWYGDCCGKNWCGVVFFNFLQSFSDKWLSNLKN